MIEQVKFSDGVRFFEAGFCKRWGVKPYFDINKSCLFAGVYTERDVDIINNHKGLKIIWNTGRIRDIFNMINPRDVVIMESSIIDHSLIKGKYKTKKTRIQIKDFSMFKPNPLGDSIYCYLGSESSKYIMGYDLIQEIKKETNFKIIEGYLGHHIEYVKKEYYDKCFVNIKPNIVGGITTAVELAYMGRFTISDAKAPFCINSLDNILSLIDQESKKIGTTQDPVIGDYFNTGEEWLNENFWI